MHLTGVAAKAADRAVQHKLMPVGVALDANGAPTPALMKRLLGLGAGAEAVPSLQRRSDGKTEALYFETVVPGASLDEGLQRALDETLAKLPIPKLMSYQLDDGWSTVNFVRPAHGLVALHGDAIVRCYALGLVAGRTTQGHRFEAAQHPISLRDADSYEQQLESEGAVIASFAARRAALQAQLQAAAAREALVPIDDDALLDEVTALVERPNVLPCAFEPQFLAVPPECLILTMKANQKYFPLLDAAGESDAQVPGRQQHPPRRREPRDRRQRACRAPASCRCQVLLRSGPQEDAGVARAGAGQRGLPRQARHARRTHREVAPHRASRSAGSSAAPRSRRARTRRRCLRRPTC